MKKQKEKTVTKEYFFAGQKFEEYGFIQRTGENFRDFNDNDNRYKEKKYKEEMKEIKEDNEFFAGVDEKDVDEEGFVEVKKTKKNKKNKKNKDDEED